MAFSLSDELRTISTHYEPTTFLASGYFGTTYLCRERQTGRDVVAKVVDRQTFAAFQARTATSLSLASEVNQLQQNIEPGLLRLLKHVVTPLSSILITEYCGGGTLLDHLLIGGSLSAVAAAEASRCLLVAVAC